MQDYKGTLRYCTEIPPEKLKLNNNKKNTIIENRFLQIFQPCSVDNYNSLNCHW